MFNKCVGAIGNFVHWELKRVCRLGMNLNSEIYICRCTEGKHDEAELRAWLGAHLSMVRRYISTLTTCMMSAKRLVKSLASSVFAEREDGNKKQTGHSLHTHGPLKGPVNHRFIHQVIETLTLYRLRSYTWNTPHLTISWGVWRPNSICRLQA